MYKFMSISMIKNEADIIESFVRYNMNFLYKMIFIDNGCTDNTIKILNLLKKENYNIEIFDEAHTYYDQYIVENKYIHKIAKENKCDFIVPLDADEFIYSDSNLADKLQQLNTDSVQYIYWRTYIVPEEGVCDGNIIENMKYIRDDKYDKTYTKVIIPRQLVINYPIIMSMGHHTVENFDGLKIEVNNDIKLAHFPIRSVSQLESKIYIGAISQMMNSKRLEGQGEHWFQLYRKLLKDESIDIIYESYSYALSQEEIDTFNKVNDIKYSPLKINDCNNIACCYSNLSKVNLKNNILQSMEAMVFKNLQKDNSIIHDIMIEKKTKCLIYGTGKKAKGLLQEIDRNEYEILAYIDSDINKEFMVFNERIIISPDKIKFFKYDKIIVASTYYDEIKKILLRYHIATDKIEDFTFFVRERIQRL